MPFASSPPWHARLVPWLGLAALIVIADQATKILIERVFDFGDVRPVTGFFNLVLTYNKGEFKSIIDFMLVSPALRQRYIKGSFRVPQGSIETTGSDHNPIVATFQTN